MMHKKGVNLVVASVLLTLLAIVLGVVIYDWASTVFIALSPEVDCFGVDFRAEIVQETSGLWHLNAVNLANLRIDGFIIKYTNEEEGELEIYEELYVTLEPGRSESFELSESYIQGRYLVVPRVEGEDPDGEMYFKACKDIYGYEVVIG